MPWINEVTMRKDVKPIRVLHAGNLDAARPEPVAKRRKTGHWTAREQLDAFLDLGSFAEYGGLSRPVRDDMTDAVDGQSCAGGMEWSVCGRGCDAILVE